VKEVREEITCSGLQCGEVHGLEVVVAQLHGCLNNRTKRTLSTDRATQFFATHHAYAFATLRIPGGPSGPVVSLIRREAEAAVIGDLAAAGSIPAIGKKRPTPHALMGNPPSQDNGFPARKGLP